MRIFNKKYLFILTLWIICIFSVTSVSANDLNATDEIISVEDTVDKITINEKTECLSANYTPKTFDEIQTAVDSASEGDTVILDGYYQFNNTVAVNKKLNFVGINDATVDGNNSVQLFRISYKNDVTFKNIIFKNAYYDSYGAAINGGTAVNCTFINNSAFRGGAISNVNAVNCTFVNNSAFYGSGGAMEGGSAVNCTFVNNSAYGLYASSGGAIHEGSAVNCIFINNSASSSGGAISGYGNLYSAVNCIFINNSAGDYGGAIWHCSVFNSTFKFNSATTGGVIYESSAVNCTFFNNSAFIGGVGFKSDFLKSSFVNNSAKYNGGVLYNCSAVNCSFVNNSAKKYHGGAVEYSTVVNCSFIGNSASSSGGAINNGVIVNCSFIGNSAKRGGAAYYSTVVNCSFVNNSAKEIGGALYECDVSGSLFINNSAAFGGAIYCEVHSADLYGSKITNCEFINCFANNQGGAIYLNITAKITLCTFDKCTSGDGTGIAVNPSISDYLVQDCIFDTYPQNIEYHYVTNLNTDNLTFFNGEEGVLIANLSDVRGPLVNKRITLTINNKNYNVTTDSDGIVRFNIPDYLNKAGIYNSTLNYDGDEINNPVSVNLTVTINKHISNLNVDDLIIYKNEYGLLVANLSNIRGPLSGKKIIFTLNGQDYPKTTGADGIVDFNPQNFLSTMGDFIVGVRFEGDDFNTPVSTNVSVLIINYKGTLSVELDGKYYNDTVISCKLINYKNNNPIYNAPIKLAFSNGEIVYLSTDVNGMVTYNIPFNPGYYSVTASVNQSYVDVNNATLEDIEINKIFGVIEHYTLNNNKTLKFKLYNPSNLDVFRNVRLNLTFSNGEKVEIVTDGEGIATYDIPFPKGTYSVSVIVVGDFKEFEDDYLENIVIENDLNCSINFTNDIVFDFSSYGSTNFTVDGGIVEQDNIYVLNHPEGIVSLKGNVITVFGLPTGNHTLVVTTTPDEYHNAVTAYLNITVNNINSKVIFSADIVFDYGMSGSIYVSVEGGSILKENIAVLNHPEANIDFTNDIITISDLDVGKYNLTVLTTPDNDHNAINSSVTFTIKEVDSDIIFNNDIVYTQGESGTTNITAIGCAENVGIISVDGHSEAIINMQNNVITVSGLNFGNYTLRIDTAPDKNHKSVSRTAKITVNKLFSKVTFAGDIVFDYGGIGYTNMAITGGVVLLSDVSVDNHSEAVISLGSNNLITVSNLSAGNYVLRVVTTPDDSHRSVEATANIVVNKINSDISFNKNSLSFGYSGSDSITATVKGGSLLQPNIVVVGQPDAKIRLDNNVITVSDLDAGSYTLYVVTTPDDNHNSVSVSIDIIVNKIDSKLTLSNDVIFDYGSSGSTVIGAGSDSVSLDGISIVDYPNAKIGLNNNVITVSDLEAGSYTLHVSTTPNKNYNSITRSVNVVVNKINSVVNLKNTISFDYGGYGTTEVSVIGGTISVSDISVVNYPNAKISLKDNVITVSGLNAGNYTLKVSSTGDTNHKSVEALTSINVNKVDSDFTLNNDINFNYGKSGFTSVVAYGCSIVKSGISVDNHNEAIIDIKDNVITVSNLDVGTYTLRVVSTPDGNHKSVTKTVGIAVAKSDSSVGFTNNISFDYGDLGTTTLILDGCTVKQEDCYVTGHSEAVVKISDKNVISVSNLTVGEYTLHVSSYPDSNHIAVDADVPITVNRIDSRISFTKSSISFKFAMSGSTPVVLENCNVASMSIVGKTVKPVLKNNVISVSGLAVGKYVLKVVTKPVNDNYNSVEMTVPVVVTKNTAKITVKKQTFAYKKAGKWAITLKDSSGKAISKVKVTLKVYTGKKSKPYASTVTNSKGVAYFNQIKALSLGNHRVIVSFSHAGYTCKSVSSVISVVKQTPLKFVVTSKTTPKGFSISVIVKDKTGKRYVNGVKVKLSIGSGKNMKSFVLVSGNYGKGKGVCAYSTNMMPVGTHKVAVTSAVVNYVGSAVSKVVLKANAKKAGNWWEKISNGRATSYGLK